ncbi:MAG TPA: SPOR domain-containing protein [Casimicrobiaceae bacterium]|nr:SPOR domain-containing protein [Casimicrobiaceae bacterium]
MRIVVIFLALANIALFVLFALIRFDPSTTGEPHRLVQQVQPDKIKILTPQQVAALGPTKTAALNDVCVEWGPMSEAERVRAVAELAPLNLAPLMNVRRVETGGFSVTLPGFANLAAAERRAAEFRARGISDVSAVDLGRGQFIVALGVFRSEASANGRADALAAQGVSGTRVTARNAGVQQLILVFRDPPQPAVARLRELIPSYAGTELRVGTCERAS